MLVHVIGKWPGQRFQFEFKDGTADDFVLRAVRTPGGRMRCGRAGFIEKVDETFGQPIKTLFPDPESLFLVDDPTTVITAGHADENNEFVEDKRLAGPPADETKGYAPMLR